MVSVNVYLGLLVAEGLGSDFRLTDLIYHLSMWSRTKTCVAFDVDVSIMILIHKNLMLC